MKERCMSCGAPLPPGKPNTTIRCEYCGQPNIIAETSPMAITRLANAEEKLLAIQQYRLDKEQYNRIRGEVAAAQQALTNFEQIEQERRAKIMGKRDQYKLLTVGGIFLLIIAIAIQTTVCIAFAMAFIMIYALMWKFSKQYQPDPQLITLQAEVEQRQKKLGRVKERVDTFLRNREARG